MPRGQLTFITETSEVLAKKLCKTLIRYHWIFKTRLTWKSELWSLNCCIYWTTVVISIKFAGYMKWTLSYEICKFGDYISYNSKDIEFFLGVTFLARPVHAESDHTWRHADCSVYGSSLWWITQYQINTTMLICRRPLPRHLTHESTQL